MRWIVAALVSLSLSGCVVPTDAPAPGQRPSPEVDTGDSLPPTEAARNFVNAVQRVEPVAESYCRRLAPRERCDFRIVIDDRPNQAPNAFQTVDGSGNPILGFNLALIANAQNIDEIAFVMGHEAAHHIRGHLPIQQQSATEGALLAGILVSLGGGGQAAVQQAQQIGATVGARRFSKGFELEADALGAEITERAGFDALRGAAFFSRLPDPGDQFLGSHPPNAQRLDTVRQVVGTLR